MVELLVVLAIPVMCWAVGYVYGRNQQEPDFKYKNEDDHV